MDSIQYINGLILVIGHKQPIQKKASSKFTRNYHKLICSKKGNVWAEEDKAEGRKGISNAFSHQDEFDFIMYTILKKSVLKLFTEGRVSSIILASHLEQEPQSSCVMEKDLKEQQVSDFID